MWTAHIWLWGLVNTIMIFNLFLRTFIAGGNTTHSEPYGASLRFRVTATPYGASRSHSLDTPHSVGLLWTTHQPDAETSTSQHPQQSPRLDSNPRSQQASCRRP
jgi:hypothetical protein